MSIWIPVLIVLLLVLSRLALHPALYASSSRNAELPDSSFEYLEIDLDTAQQDIRRGNSKSPEQHLGRRQLKQVGGGSESFLNGGNQHTASLQVPAFTLTKRRLLRSTSLSLISPNSTFMLDSTRSTPSPPSSPVLSITPITLIPQRHRNLRSASTLPGPRQDSYLASASGSQTEGADGADEQSSDSDGGERMQAFSMLDLGVLEGRGKGKKRELVSSPQPTTAGENGRGEYVLVDRKSLSPGDNKSKTERRKSWDGLRGGTWGTALFEALEGHSLRPVRRSSPGVRIPRTSRNRPLRPPEPIIREPTPPLTLDSINTSFNPFPLFHIRLELLPEISLTVGLFLFAIYKLSTMQPSATYPSIPPLPLQSFLILALSVPFIAVIRRPTSYFKVPFTDERGYRDARAADDGVTAAILLPLLLASACYYDAYSGAYSGLGDVVRPLMELWEASSIHGTLKSGKTFDPTILSTPFEMARGLFQARYELVILTALNVGVLLLHLVLARTLLKIEKLPTSNARRFFGAIGVSALISFCVFASLHLYDWLVGGTLPISPLEGAATTYIQQTSFYIVSRLARRGFTLGELSTMTAAGNALCLEFWRLSRARWLYKRGYPAVPPTFRSPTPIIAYQSILIPGAFLTGFLLSPLLVISRHIAQKPSHRIKWPMERLRQRRLLAAGVFFGLTGIIVFGLGGWSGWMLGGNLLRPWTWAATFVISGTDQTFLSSSSLAPTGWKRWKRLVLVAYWVGTIVVAVGGWQTRLVRARRIRMRKGEAGTLSSPSIALQSVGKKSSNTLGLGGLGLSRGSGGGEGKKAGSTLVGIGKVGAEDAREEKRVHASLNMRRKFFHALAVTMFLPGIAIDPSFTSLAFSVAFALFTFCEYARYFALYPIGAPLHIFFSEFIDSKDSGPVILSHFYLLTGCAGGLWLEGRGINRFTGVLVLGIGDAMASIVGKLIGRIRWPGTSKTVEGTLAFIFSIVFSAWLLRLIGLTPDFSLVKYTIATTLAGLMEAVSHQNDNVVIPIYMWSVIALMDV